MAKGEVNPSSEGTAPEDTSHHASKDQLSYTQINRGRYLCPDHGGFCDEFDGFLDHCPLCSPEAKHRANWQPNEVSRLLKIINGFQERNRKLLTNLVAASGLTFAIIETWNRFFKPKDGSDVTNVGNAANNVDAEYIERIISNEAIGIGFLIFGIFILIFTTAQISVTEKRFHFNQKVNEKDNSNQREGEKEKGEDNNAGCCLKRIQNWFSNLVELSIRRLEFLSAWANGFFLLFVASAFVNAANFLPSVFSLIAVLSFMLSILISFIVLFLIIILSLRDFKSPAQFKIEINQTQQDQLNSYTKWQKLFKNRLFFLEGFTRLGLFAIGSGAALIVLRLLQ